MGAAEWTGCYPSGPSNTASSPYSYYHQHSHSNHHHHHHTQHQQYPNQLTPLASTSAATGSITPVPNSSVALSHPYSSIPSYDASTAALTGDHANFYLPSVLSDMQPFCASSDYHTAAATSIVSPHTQSHICSPSHYSSGKTDVESLNTAYPSYNNWSNGYNNYQQPQYPPAAPTMVLCPQLYSVNQNQIHLHVHSSSDKIEQYLGGANENSLTISSLGPNPRNSVEIGIGTSDHEQTSANILQGTHQIGNVGNLSEINTINEHNSRLLNHPHSTQQIQSQHSGHAVQQQTNINNAQREESSGRNIQAGGHIQHAQTRDEDVGELGTVWRPY